MNDTIIAAKAKEQHENFLGRVFAHFSKPKARFVREATYGIQASGDTKLSSIVRATDDDVAPIQTRVRDASRSSKEGRDVVVNGCHGCIAAATGPPSTGISSRKAGASSCA